MQHSLKRRIDRIEEKLNPEGRVLVADGFEDPYYLPDDYDPTKDMLVVLTRRFSTTYPQGKVPRIVLKGKTLPYGDLASKEQRDAAVAAAQRADT